MSKRYTEQQAAMAVEILRLSSTVNIEPNLIKQAQEVVRRYLGGAEVAEVAQR